MRKPPIKMGLQVLFENDKSRKKLSYIDKMKVKIDSQWGRRQYSKRLGCIEPVFGILLLKKTKSLDLTRSSESTCPMATILPCS
ncbi:hypothetical protein ABIS04_12020 [Shewanella sp. H8]|uniref:hypothetical protein n=1 Tax=Shewanella sp. H8 TaxID=3342676 RepID=UPI0033156348